MTVTSHCTGMYDGIMHRCGQTVARATLFNGGLRLCSAVVYASVQRWVMPLFIGGLRLFSSVGYASV